MPIFAVAQAEIDAVLTYPIPPAPYNFDAAELRALVASSFSITLDEKLAIIDGFPTLDVPTITHLRAVLEEERVTFAALNAKWESRLDAAAAQEHRRSFHVVR